MKYNKCNRLYCRVKTAIPKGKCTTKGSKYQTIKCTRISGVNTNKHRAAKCSMELQKCDQKPDQLKYNADNSTQVQQLQ